MAVLNGNLGVAMVVMLDETRQVVIKRESKVVVLWYCEFMCPDLFLLVFLLEVGMCLEYSFPSSNCGCPTTYKCFSTTFESEVPVESAGSSPWAMSQHHPN